MISSITIRREPFVPRTCWTVGGLAVIVGLSAARADDAAERQRAEQTLAQCRAEAARYVLRVGADRSQDVKFAPDSLLKWHNSVNQNVHGNIFIGTRSGRPEVLASIYRFFSPKTQLDVEFQSLSLTPFVMERDQQVIWSPAEPGIVLRRFDRAAAPPASKQQRQIEMRRLASEFDVEMTEYQGESYRLRLMSKPLYRYESTDPQVLDGALFAYTYTTDPEVLIAIEARKVDDGFQWEYGIARMNTGKLSVSHHGREVWTAAALDYPFHDPQRIYTILMDVSASHSGQAIAK